MSSEFEESPMPVHGQEQAGEEVSEATRILQGIRSEIEKVFVGQHELVELVLAAFVSSGHVLIEGHPGLGKTHLVNALARAFQGQFKRIQFTPDLMPSDVTGHSLYDMRSQEFQLKRGPVFTNLLLADEINRAPAKTQSALLEVMQEGQATIDGESHLVPSPFMVLATQNPIEQDGTYPLPEAQLDRFMMKLYAREPNLEEEIVIAKRVTRSGAESLSPDLVSAVCRPEEVTLLRHHLEQITISDSVLRYAVQLVQATRTSLMTNYGASPRASISMIQAAKGVALLAGRGFVIPDDVKRCSLPVLRHRISLTAETTISGQTVDDAVVAIVNSVEAPRE